MHNSICKYDAALAIKNACSGVDLYTCTRLRPGVGEGGAPPAQIAEALAYLYPKRVKNGFPLCIYSVDSKIIIIDQDLPQGARPFSGGANCPPCTPLKKTWYCIYSMRVLHGSVRKYTCKRNR